MMSVDNVQTIQYKVAYILVRNVFSYTNKNLASKLLKHFDSAL